MLGRPPNLDNTIEQWPTVLAVGASGGYLDIFFFRLSLSFSFSLFLGDGLV